MTLVSLRRRLPVLPPLAVDAALFALSAVFAVLLWANSDLSAHRDWARDAIPGYLVCAAAAGAAALLRPDRVLRVRAVLTAVCFVLVALIPMVLMVRARAAATTEVHVLPEVAVIERAGARLAKGEDPYVADVVHGRLQGQVRGVPRYEAYFPYFPLMSVLGLPAAIPSIGAFGDARLWMALLTFGCVVLGLRLARPPPDRTLRALQVLWVLPTGSLFLAGGGDDLPVLAVCFAALAAVSARREVAGGVAFGVAMAMKLTAWPIAALSLLVLRERTSTRAAMRSGALMAAIVAVVVLPFFVWDPRTFVSNVIEFPLGLSPINSPAASPLPGHVLTVLVPAAHRVLLVGLVVLGGPLLAWWLVRRPPRDVASVCRQSAVIAIIVMCVAPATRVGYVVYPVNLLVWSWLLDPAVVGLRGTAAPGAREAVSPGCRSGTVGR